MSLLHSAAFSGIKVSDSIKAREELTIADETICAMAGNDKSRPKQNTATAFSMITAKSCDSKPCSEWMPWNKPKKADMYALPEPPLKLFSEMKSKKVSVSSSSSVAQIMSSGDRRRCSGVNFTDIKTDIAPAAQPEVEYLIPAARAAAIIAVAFSG